jgi:hypothetical protein
MRQVSAGLVLGVALLAPVLAGCNLAPVLGNRDPGARAPERKPDVPALVHYLNDNANRVQAVQSNRIAIDCQQGSQKIGLDGMMVCQKPRNFRLRARLIGQPAVDIGSNDEEFWYWISKADPPHVFHCSYRELSTGRVFLPFPFQPDMVVAALGMAQYDANAKYELRATDRYLELIQGSTSPAGQPVQRITVFNRLEQKAPQPQVVAHVLKDMKGKLICQANIHQVQVDRATGALLPTKVSIEWPEQKLKMTLTLYDAQSTSVDATRAARLFQRTDLSGLSSFDLARRAVDSPDAVRRAGAVAPVPR